MFYAFLKLQWKSFFRGESVGANVMTKIFKWFWIVYFSFITPMLGLITYKVLKEDSVKLDDLKIKFYNSSEYSLRNIDELEKDIYRKYKALLPNFISLNDPKALEN